MSTRGTAVGTAPGRRIAAGGERDTRRPLGTFSEFRMRLRDPRFWVVQVLVVAISVAHTALEAGHSIGLSPDFYLLPVSTYFIPVVYAALNFGVEGAVPTALWSALLVVPNLVLWHTSAERPGVVLELVIIVVISYVIARRVDLETVAKERAEAASARLERLNQTAAASARSLDLDSVLSRTLEAMLDPERSQKSWVVLTPEQGEGEKLLVASTAGTPAEIGSAELAVTRAVVAGARTADDGTADGDGTVPEEWLAVVPLRVSGGLAGAIGLESVGGGLSPSDTKLVEAVANQLGVALGNIRYLNQTQVMVSELSRAQQELEDYVRLATDAQEEERKRLARELHDDTIQALVIAKAELDALAAVEKPLSESARRRLDKVDAMLTAAIGDVRRFSRDLRPSLLDDLGLVHAIDWLVGDLGARAAIDAKLRISGEPRRLGQREELALFRIVQEALRNVERHATAKSVEVEMVFGDDVRATVIDDGLGFDTSKVLDDPDTSPRLGLLGMRERAKLAGASLSISSRPLAGTRVSVSLQTHS